MLLYDATPRLSRLDALRARTLALLDLAVDETVLHERPLPAFRPIIWHLAHIGVFEGYWILQRGAGEASLSPRYDRIFDPIATPREESDHLPRRAEMETFLAETRRRERCCGAWRAPSLGRLVSDVGRHDHKTHENHLHALAKAR
jgi:hypothetical protein